MTEPDNDVGAFQLPYLPKAWVVELSMEVKVAEVVTLTYFLGLVPPVQVEVQDTVVPDVHSQNTVLVAVTPVSPVAFCAVVLMLSDSVEAIIP